MKSRSIRALCGALMAAVLVLQAPGLAQMRKPTGVSAITEADLKEWLTYLASDQLQGRATYTEGLGLAASYIAEHLKAWGVKPGGEDGSYFQVVKVNGVTVKRNSTVTVTANGQTRTFKDGEGVTFPANAGGKQTITAKAEFVGYGLSLPDAGIDDYKERDAAGKVVIYLGRGPQNMPAGGARLLGARARNAIELKKAVAAIGLAAAPGGGRGGPGRGGATPPTVVQPSTATTASPAQPSTATTTPAQPSAAATTPASTQPAGSAGSVQTATVIGGSVPGIPPAQPATPPAGGRGG